MKKGYSPRIFLAASALALGLSTAALAVPPRGDGPDGSPMADHHMMFGGHGLTRLHDDLKLDAKQEALWQQAEKAGQDSRNEMRDRMRKQHDELLAEIDKPGADLRAIAKRMDDFRAEGQKLHEANRDRWLAVYDALNPEQKEKARVFFKSMIERMGKMGDHMGRMGRMDRRGPAPDAK